MAIFNLKKTINNQQNFKTISRYMPNDHTKTVSAEWGLSQKLEQQKQDLCILDLGCGDGSLLNKLSSQFSQIDWHGVDIEDSQEVRSRQHSLQNIKTFDGINLPYENDTFDVVYSNQVLEHVRHPDELIQNVFQCMKPGGLFIGSVSQLEPYHSRSIFNFTPYAITQVFEDAGFNILEIRPGSDAWSLISRQMLNRRLKFIWNNNLLYGFISAISKFSDLDNCHVNFLKIQFAGHLSFLATKELL